MIGGDWRVTWAATTRGTASWRCCRSTLPCHGWTQFGIITRTDRPLSPAAKVMMKALKTASMSVYGRKLEMD
jgi:hypothetical protein